MALKQMRNKSMLLKKTKTNRKEYNQIKKINAIWIIQKEEGCCIREIKEKILMKKIVL